MVNRRKADLREVTVKEKGYTVCMVLIFLHRAYAFVFFYIVFRLIVFDANRIIVTGR